MLRCTLAGIIPLMNSKKYSVMAEEFYEAQKGYFDDIIKNKSYYLLRDLPVTIAQRILMTEVPAILSRQKTDGLWHSGIPGKTSYDILTAFRHIHLLDELIREKRLKNVQLAGKQDYYFLLIKAHIFEQTDLNDEKAKGDFVRQMQTAQLDDGSWEGTVVATVYHLDRLLNLGVPVEDSSIQEGIDFLFRNLNEELEAQQGSGKPYGLKGKWIFSTADRSAEFAVAEKLYPEFVPKGICYGHLGMMQNALCLKLLLRLGLESDARVEAALDGVYSLYQDYSSLCYFKIQKRIAARKKENTSFLPNCVL